MKIRLLGALVLIACPAYAQQTTCITTGSTMTCDTPRQVPSAPVDYTAGMFPGSQSTAPDPADERREERRAQAYGRVGDLIGKGDCEGASRLARFYGNRILIADTERACKR